MTAQMRVRQIDDERMPDWLKSELRANCPYCGSPMLNCYNKDGRCTNRRCENDSCKGMIAARADFMRKLLDIKGAGFASNISDVSAFKIKNQLELLTVWGIKPKVDLGTYLRMHCFEGIDSEWDRITKELNVYTLDELYERYTGKWKQLLEDNKELLYNDLKYITLKENDIHYDGPAIKHVIMITGTPYNFASKDDFINQVNEACAGRIITIHQKTKRQSNVDFLIREPTSTTRGKVEAAIKGGIPIITSQEYLDLLHQEILELNNVQS